MFSILGAVLFGLIATMTVLVACGLPLGMPLREVFLYEPYFSN